MPPTILLNSLQTVRRRVKVLGVLYGVGILLTAVVVLLLATVGLDYLMNLRPIPRVIIALGSLACVGYVASRWVIRPLMSRLSISDVAGRLEQVFPQFNDRLRSTVDFIQSDVPGSETMKERVVGEASDLAGKLNLGRAVVPAPAWYAMGAGIGAIVLALALGWLTPRYANIAMARLFSPFADNKWPKWVQIEMAGDIPKRVPVGQRVDVRMKLARGDSTSRRATIIYKYDDGPEQKELMIRGMDGTYSASLDARVDAGKSASSLHIRMEAGDDAKEIDPITVVPRLAIKSVDAQVTPPAYVNSQQPASMNLVTAPAMIADGSTVKLLVSFTKPLAPDSKVELVPVSQEIATPEVAWQNDTASSAAGTWLARKSVRFHLRAKDNDGFVNNALEEYEIIVRPDQNPSVQIENPRRNEERTGDSLVPLVGLAEDDYGIQSLKLMVERIGDKQKWEIGLLENNEGTNGATATRAEGAADRLRLRVNYSWQLSQLKDANLKSGDVLEYYLLVKDNFNLDNQQHAEVASGRLRITIVTAEELAARVMDDLRQVRSQIQRIREGVDRTRVETRELANDTRDRQQLDQADRAQLDRLTNQQATSTSQTMQLANRVGTLRDRLAENRMQNPELNDITTNVANDLQQAAENPMRQATGQLSQANRQNNNAGQQNQNNSAQPQQQQAPQPGEGQQQQQADAQQRDANAQQDQQQNGQAGQRSATAQRQQSPRPGEQASPENQQQNAGQNQNDQQANAEAQQRQGEQNAQNPQQAGERSAQQGQQTAGNQQRGQQQSGQQTASNQQRGGQQNQQQGQQAAGNQQRGQQQPGQQTASNQQPGGQQNQQQGNQQQGQQTAGNQQNGQQQSGQQQSGQQQSGQQQTASNQQQGRQNQQGQQNQQQQQPGQQTPAQRDQALARAAENQQQASEQLQRAIDRMNGIGSMQETMARLRQLLEQQQQVSRDTRDVGRENIGRTPEQMSQQDRQRLNEVADQQQRLSEQTQQALQDMQRQAEQMQRSDQSSSQAMQRAAQTGQQQQTPQNQQRASQSARQNQQAQAQQAQRQAELGLQMMVDQLREAEQHKLAELQKRLEEMQNQIANLVRRQAGHNLDNLVVQGPDKLAAIEEAARKDLYRKAERDPADAAQPMQISQLSAPQEQTERNTRDLSKSAEEMSNGAETASHLTRAAGRMERAIVNLRDRKLPDAYDPSQVEALAELDSASKTVDQMKENVDEQMEDQRKEALRQRYVKIREQQQKVNEETARIDKSKGADGALARPETIRLGQLPAEQGKLSETVDGINEDLIAAGSTVYVWANKDIAESMTEVKDDLGKQSTGQATQAEQTRIAEQLDAMIRNLATQRRRSPYAQENQDQQQQQDQQGQRRQQQANRAPRLPTEAELRLLQDLQRAVNKSTIVIDALPDKDKPKLVSLGNRQGDLRGVLDEMIQKSSQGKMKLGPEPDPKTQLPEEASTEQIENQELDKDLLQGVPEEEKGEKQANLIGDRMGRSRQRLALNTDPGQTTQLIQKRIIDDFDQLIDQAREQEAQTRNSQQQRQRQQQQAQARQRQQQQQRGQQMAQNARQQQAQNQQQQNQQNGNQAANASIAPGVSQINTDLSKEIVETASEWGKLSPRQRKEVLDSKDEAIIERYRNMIQDYYRSMSNKGAGQ